MKILVMLPVAVVAASLSFGACNSTKSNTSAQEVEPAQSPATQASAAAPAATTTSASVAKIISVEPGSGGKPGAGTTAPNFTWRGADGVEHSLAEYKGKTVLLNFWATWCPPCRRELPDLVNIHSMMDPAKVAVIGVSLDMEAPQGMSVADYVASFAKENNLQYPMMIGNGELVTAYGGIEGIPTTFVIDPDGKVSELMVGARSEQVFRKSIEAAAM